MNALLSPIPDAVDRSSQGVSPSAGPLAPGAAMHASEHGAPGKTSGAAGGHGPVAKAPSGPGAKEPPSPVVKEPGSPEANVPAAMAREPVPAQGIKAHRRGIAIE